MDLVRKKDNRTGLAISVVIHVMLLLVILLSKGCGEIQNPPQFTLEEVIVLDFSEAGGGNPGSSAPKKTPPVEQTPAPKQVTQEESAVSTPSSNSNRPTPESKPNPEPTKEVVEQPKNDFSNLFGKGSGDSESGNGEGEGTGIGTGKGPNTGGGMGDGKGRQVIGKPELDNPKNWVGFVMVQFIIDQDGNVVSTKVLYPHSKTTVTLTTGDQKFIEADCKRKFRFTPTSTGVIKDRLVKRIQYIKK